ncbi:MAG: EamA family transporter [Ruminococcus sp.]|nr:EamA family transporter [Ruminococcus sp.]
MKAAYFKHIFSLLLFGTNGIVASLISLSSYEIVLFRTMIGSVFLLSVFFITGGRLTAHKHRKSLGFLTVSGISMGLSWMFLYEAYQQTGVSISTLLYNCGPVIVMILSPFMFKEKLTAVKITGFAAVLAGVFLINGANAEKINIWGILCGLMSAVTYSTMVMFNKKASDISGLENSALQLFISFITVSVFIGIKQGFAIDVSASDIIPIIILGLMGTGVGCYLYFSSIGKLPAQTVAVCGYLESLSAVVFSMIFLKERLSPLQIVGAVLIIGGAMLGELYKKKKAPA